MNTNNISIEDFLIQHLIENKKYEDISDKYGLESKELTKMWDSNEGLKIREDIKKAKQIFNNRKNNPDFKYFKDKGIRYFYEWYKKQPKICGYCGIEEAKLKELFDKNMKILDTKRKRGPSLELERKNTDTNIYNEENCIMACYFCNNHKSDIISAEDHKKYFAESIKNYLEDKYKEIKIN